MSEKALRGYIKGAIEIYEALEQKGLDSGGIPMILNAALADDPDVVEVLRRATQGSLEAINHFEKFMYNCEIRWIQDTFHVRLTDGGYEWTDSSTGASSWR